MTGPISSVTARAGTRATRPKARGRAEPSPPPGFPGGGLAVLGLALDRRERVVVRSWVEGVGGVLDLPRGQAPDLLIGVVPA